METRDSLLYYCRGLVLLLEECTTARNVHCVGNLSTTLKSWIQILERPQGRCPIEMISRHLPEISERVKVEHRRWRAVQPSQKEA